MISVDDALSIHALLIDRFGGSKGLRDRAGLEAALARPFATFAGEALYPTPVDKAAALFESMLINHPFIDGNKRIAYVLMRLTLLQSLDFATPFDIKASQDEKYEMVISAATGRLRFEGIKTWILTHLVELAED